MSLVKGRLDGGSLLRGLGGSLKSIKIRRVKEMID